MRRSTAALSALVALAAGLLGLSAPDRAVSSHAPGGALLPDLQTQRLSNLSISTSSGQRLLRFANEIANLHTGPLELFPVSEDCDGDGQSKNDRTGYQRIYFDSDGNGYFTRGIDSASTTVKVGCFVNHPRHHHWHTEDFADYRLYTFVGGVRGAIVGASEKVSFCIIDSRLVSALPGTPTSAYYRTCDRADTQGMSVGWSDIYGANLVGQSIDITGLADGTYCLVSVADPVNRISETDDENNEASVKVTIAGTTITWQPYQSCSAGSTDTSPPTAPAGLTAAGSISSISLSWEVATDDTGVARYNVHRSTTAGFVPSATNRIAQPSGTSHTDSDLAPGTYYYRVTAEDAAGNVGSASNEASAAAAADTTAPTVALTEPADGTTVSGTITVSATASDDVGVAAVQFLLDGANLGTEDASEPYSVAWDTSGAANGSHTLSAVARDGAGNSMTSAPVAVTVQNTAPPPTEGLVAAYGFEESGTSVIDASGSGNTGTISGATRTASGRFGSALSFDGVDDWVTVADAASLDLTTGMTLEAWLYPTALGTSWRTVAIKEQPGQLVYALYAHTDTARPSGHVYVGGDVDTRGTSGLPLDTWTHLATTYDGSTLRLFVNGIAVSSRAVSGSMPASTLPFRLGGNSVWTEWFQGRIDEVRVYNRALSASEIQNDLNTAVAP
jgi:hypothetical protein